MCRVGESEHKLVIPIKFWNTEHGLEDWVRGEVERPEGDGE